MRASRVDDVDHTRLGVLLAVRTRLGALHIEAWSFQTGFIQTSLVKDIHHTIFGMFTAVNCRSAALDVEARSLGAGVVRALPHIHGILECLRQNAMQAHRKGV